MGTIFQSQQFLVLPKRLKYIKAETTGHLRCLHTFTDTLSRRAIDRT